MESVLGKLLIGEGHVPADRLDEALRQSVTQRGRVDTFLLEAGLIDEARLTELMAKAYGTKPADFRALVKVDLKALKLIPSRVAERCQVFPFRVEADKLHVLCPAPPDQALLDEIGEMVGLQIVPYIATEYRICRALAHFYGQPLNDRFKSLEQVLHARTQEQTFNEEEIKASVAITALDSENDEKWDLTSALARLSAATSREAVVDVALRFTAQHLECVVFFGVHAGFANSWGVRVPADAPALENRISIDLAEPSSLRTVIDTAAPYVGQLAQGPEHLKIYAALGRSLPRAALLVPVVVAKRVVGIIYADNGSRAMNNRLLGHLITFCGRIGSAFENIILKRKQAASIVKTLVEPVTSAAVLPQSIQADEAATSQPGATHLHSPANAPSRIAAEVDVAKSGSDIERHEQGDGHKDLQTARLRATELAAFRKELTKASTTNSATASTSVPSITGQVVSDGGDAARADSGHNAPENNSTFFADTADEESNADYGTDRIPAIRLAAFREAELTQKVASSAVAESDAPAVDEGTDADIAEVARALADSIQISGLSDAAVQGEATQLFSGDDDLPIPTVQLPLAKLAAFRKQDEYSDSVGSLDWREGEGTSLPGPSLATSFDEALGQALENVATEPEQESESAHGFDWQANESADEPTSSPDDEDGSWEEVVFDALGAAGMPSSKNRQALQPSASGSVDPFSLSKDSDAASDASVELSSIDTASDASDELMDGNAERASVRSAASLPALAGIDTAASESVALDGLEEEVFEDDVVFEDPVALFVATVVAPDSVLTTSFGTDNVSSRSVLVDTDVGPDTAIDDVEIGTPRTDLEDSTRGLLQDDVEIGTPRTVLEDSTRGLRQDELRRLCDEVAGVNSPVSRAALQQLLHADERIVPLLRDRFPGQLRFDPFGSDRRVPESDELSPLVSLLVARADLGAEVALAHLDSHFAALRWFAVYLIGKVHDPRAIKAVMHRLHDEEPRIRHLAAEVLRGYSADAGFEIVIKHLRSRLRSPVAEVRRRAIYFLGYFKDAGSVPFLVEALLSRESELTAEAATALTAITMQTYGSSQRKWRKWWDRNQARSRIEWLIDGLRHSDRDIRYASSVELTETARETFGYDYDGKKRDREKSVKRWERWWLEERRRMRLEE